MYAEKLLQSHLAKHFFNDMIKTKSSINDQDLKTLKQS